MDDFWRLDEGGLGCMTHVRALRLARFPCELIYRATEFRIQAFAYDEQLGCRAGAPVFSTSATFLDHL